MSANPKIVEDHALDFRLLIDGRLVKGAATLEVINPATGRPLTACARPDKAQLHAAVAAAKQAFPSWSEQGQEGLEEFTQVCIINTAK
jgi:acyl-CoA reductase-like NAD-dependent aldehyde dehydrogenase